MWIAFSWARYVSSRVWLLILWTEIRLGYDSYLIQRRDLKGLSVTKKQDILELDIDDNSKNGNTNGDIQPSDNNVKQCVSI